MKQSEAMKSIFKSCENCARSFAATFAHKEDSQKAIRFLTEKGFFAGISLYNRLHRKETPLHVYLTTLEDVNDFLELVSNRSDGTLSFCEITALPYYHNLKLNFKVFLHPFPTVSAYMHQQVSVPSASYVHLNSRKFRLDPDSLDKKFSFAEAQVFLPSLAHEIETACTKGWKLSARSEKYLVRKAMESKFAYTPLMNNRSFEGLAMTGIALSIYDLYEVPDEDEEEEDDNEEDDNF